MTQEYTGERALLWLARGLCPECGRTTDDHTGWGNPGCSLTDNGVAERIATFAAKGPS